MGWFSKATGSLFGGGSSSSSSSTSTTTNYTDSSTDFQNAASLGAASMNNKVLGAGATYTYTEGGLTGDNLKNLTNTIKTLNSDALTATKKLNSDALSATKTLSNKAFSTAENLYNKTENTLSNVFDKTVSAVQSSASKAMETTAQAYAESDDELRRAIDGLRPIALYIAFAAITYFIFRNKRW